MTPTSPLCEMTAVALRVIAGRVSAPRRRRRRPSGAHRRLQPSVNAIVTLDAEGALARAALEPGRPAARWACHGLPIVHKDSFLTARMRTTYGSPLYRDFVLTRRPSSAANARPRPLRWARPTCRIRRGLRGRFNTVFGATRNPYDLRLTAGGSSGGAATALAARAWTRATRHGHGRLAAQPRVVCNVVGLRRSPARRGMAHGQPPLTVAGRAPPRRGRRRCGAAVAAAAGNDARDPLAMTARASWTAWPVSSRACASPTRRRGAAVCLSNVQCWKCWTASCRSCRVGRARGTRLPRLHRRRRQFPGLARPNLRGGREHRHLLKDTVIWNIELGLQQSAAAVIQAERDRAALFARMHAERTNFPSARSVRCCRFRWNTKTRAPH